MDDVNKKMLPEQNSYRKAWYGDGINSLIPVYTVAGEQHSDRHLSSLPCWLISNVLTQSTKEPEKTESKTSFWSLEKKEAIILQVQRKKIHIRHTAGMSTYYTGYQQIKGM